MKKLFTTISAFIIFILFISCEENLNGPDITISNDELYNLAYSDYQWPDNFYKEDSLEGALYYENTISITPVDQRGNLWIQLCTDNIDTARHWSELSSNYSAYYRELVGEKESDKYFEFKRVYSVRPNDIKELIEYLWFVEHYDIGGKVHRSITTNNIFEYIHYIYEIQIIHGDFGMKDEINYFQHTFYVKISNGEITHKQELIKQIEGKQH